MRAMRRSVTALIACSSAIAYSPSMISRDHLAKLAEALGGIPVWGSLPGSPSRLLGVRYGDVLVSVNGVRTSSIDEYFHARRRCDTSAKVVLFRDGQELSLTFDFDDRDAGAAALESVAEEVVAARLLPSEQPPARLCDDDEN
jgi:hypothetical protein